ncbi:neck protein [uncultured Mediterranean phage]|nr:neck protein [uncultured Mediterranean phage]
MATPSTKATLKSYCLRALGFGVIDINVSDDQADDRLDEALQYFAQYHYDGIEKMYLKHLITSDDVTRARSDASTTATDTVDSSITATWKEGKNFIPIPNSVVSVVRVFPFTDTGGGSNMFDIRYQLRLNDLFDFSSTSVIQYEMTMQNLDFLEHILVGETPIRFNQHQNRLYVDMDWENDITADVDYLVIECYRKLDPTTYTDVYDDIYLKRYATALIKKQWGANLSKFKGVTMLGGVEMDGETLFTQALEEQQKLEEEIQLAFELPINYMVG